eukprot:CAMPEP_0114555418 /NCGR_PEP_ID=MMETSP0114-20121206/8738_1 /TAXON_ID=31324 /ORGANISM="Goniomonas sp, Strain m" /LENGTH=524 /DNA_ID=CAMNT_0001740541 /DNA_START=12 /DNA_END=1586 /DNA_ORIENTATION=+
MARILLQVLLVSTLGVLAVDATVLSYFVVAGKPKSNHDQSPNEVRVVLSNDTSVCPHIYIDKSPGGHKMHVRAYPSARWPVLICELTVKPGATVAQLISDTGKVELPLLHRPGAVPGRVLFVGDSGCLLKGEPEQKHQHCNDEESWPWARVAQAAASEEPEVVVHLGDYVYRVATCPVGDTGCAGDPFGDNWNSWNADFFTPAKALLEKAVWVPTRGNHEACQNMGQGFFRLLYWGKWEGEGWCRQYSEPYNVHMPHQQLLLLDTAELVETDKGFTVADELSHEQTDIYAYHFDEIKRWAREALPKRSFVASHRPLWGLGHDKDDSNYPVVAMDATLQKASSNHLPEESFVGVIGGHIHFLQHLHFDHGRQPCFVFGNSGSSLAPVVAPTRGREVAGASVTNGETIVEWGYSYIDPMEPAGNPPCDSDCSGSHTVMPRWHVVSKATNKTILMDSHINAPKISSFKEKHKIDSEMLTDGPDRTHSSSVSAAAVVGSSLGALVLVAVGVLVYRRLRIQTPGHARMI